MKLSKKLLPILAIVPTVATLSTSLTACSKNKKQSWAEAKKIALANFDEVCFAAIKTGNDQILNTVDRIKEDLFSFIKKTKNEDIVNLATKVAYDIANIAVNHSDKIETVEVEWGKVKDFCNYLVDFEDGEERIKLALTVYDDVYQKALDNIDFLPKINELGGLEISLLEIKEKSLESCQAALKLIQASFDNKNAFAKAEDIDALTNKTTTLWKDCEQNILNIEESDYILPILTSFLTNFDNTNSTIVDENFQLIKDAIGDILEFLDSESYEFARTVEYAFIAFISKSAWKINNNVYYANCQIYKWFIQFIKSSPTDPMWVFNDLYEGVLGNLLNNSSPDVENLGKALKTELENWCGVILEAYKKSPSEGPHMARAYCQFISAEFSMDKDVLFASVDSFKEINSNYKKECPEIINKWSDPCFAESMTEYASFYGKYIYAGEKLKNEPNLLSIIYDYRSWFVEHLQLAARSQNAYLIDGCSKMFEFAIETTISNHLSPINLLQEIKTLMFTTLTEIRNTAGTKFFLSDELIRFANGLFKSINEIPNTEFNDESLTAIKALSTDCFSDLNAILSKDADLISGTKLSEFILGNFFTSAISNAGKNVKFWNSDGWFTRWLSKYKSDIFPAFIEQGKYDFAAEISRIYDAAVKVMRFGEYHNWTQLNTIVDRATQMLFDFFDPTKTYAFDVYVNAILSLDHDYNHQDSVPSDLQDAKLSLTDDAAAKGNEVKLQALVNMSSVFAEEKYVVNVNPSIKNDLLSYYNANLGALYDVTAGNCATNTTLITSWYKNIYDIQDIDALHFIQNRYEYELQYLLKL